MFKSGFISIAGRPNVGKSTLLNRLMGEKIAITSHKPQTTRNKIMGVYTDERMQAIFLDTPGIHEPRNKLGEYMVSEAGAANAEADLVLFLLDATEGVRFLPENRAILDRLGNDKRVILVINKVDLADKPKLLPMISAYSGIADFKSILPISALKGEGAEELLKIIYENLPEGPKYFPEDTLTDQPERVIVAEIVREKLFRRLSEEIPFGTMAVVEKMKNDDRGVCHIDVTIFCEKKSHKGIVIGKDGHMLKQVGTDARGAIERFLGGKVMLTLWVKVMEDWREREKIIKGFGYK